MEPFYKKKTKENPINKFLKWKKWKDIGGDP
jgi:hypothetical protein